MNLEKKHPVELPRPTGIFGVGTTTFCLTDKSRKEIYSHDSRHPYRELVLQMWYPAALKGNEAPAPYISSSLKLHISEVLEKKEPFLFGGGGYVDAEVITHAFLNADVSEIDANYPVIVFSHGFGAPSYLYTNLFEELASHGYVVVAINHTYTSEPTEFPDGRIIRASSDWEEFVKDNDKLEKAHDLEIVTWIADLQFVLDELVLINRLDTQNRFSNKLDLNRVGVMGHSFGGAAATSLCRIDARCKAGVNMEGPLFGSNQDVGFDKPFMFLFAEPFKVPAGHPNENYYNAVFKQNEERIAKLFDNISNDVYHVVLRDADHMDFSDWNLLTKTSECKGHSLEELDLARNLLVSFFDRYLSGKLISILETFSQEQADVKYRLKTASL